MKKQLGKITRIRRINLTVRWIRTLSDSSTTTVEN